jgi:hypothetical protein
MNNPTTPLPSANFSSDLREITVTLRQLIECLQEERVNKSSNGENMLSSLRRGSFDFYLIKSLFEENGFKCSQLDSKGPSKRLSFEKEGRGRKTACFIFDPDGRFELPLKSNKKELDLQDEWLVCFTLKYVFIYRVKDIEIPQDFKEEIFTLQPRRIGEYQVMQFGETLID